MVCTMNIMNTGERDVGTAVLPVQHQEQISGSRYAKAPAPSSRTGPLRCQLVRSLSARVVAMICIDSARLATQLQVFAQHPQLREQRFRVRQDRREHLQRQIAQNGLDMSHVTDRRGSPQTLVCRKTRESYRRQCRQHAEDIAAMRALQALGVAAPDADRARLAAAVTRQPQAVED